MKLVTLKLDDRVYEELARRARDEGFATVSDYIGFIISKYIDRIEHKESYEEATKKSTVIDKIMTLIERKVQDSVNPFTQKVDDLGRKVATLLERLEVVEERLSKLEKIIKTVETKREEVKVQEKSKKSAIEILKEQKIIFEKDVANKIRNRDSFFVRLEQEGAIVIEAKDERIAVEPSFWNSFVNKLKLTRTNNDDELKKIFDPIELKLLQKLKESALIVYDGTSRNWNLLL
ncbi:MAG: hypothetical protein QW101_03925 [Ignisphaera sp.]|uniref:CopG family transcriptional regulator n=1 Tax=Ignisphaera aggregans TaxID=334771 RepID=A0A7J3MXA5_9CREN